MADSLAKALLEAQGLQAESRMINDILIIDAEERVIGIPGTEILFGVESDEKSERKYFECPRFVGDNIDLLQYGVQINYKNANDESDIYIVSDVEEIEGAGNVTFSWLLSRKVTKYKGQVAFIVCATSIKDNKVTNEWNTTLAYGNVLEGLEVNDILIEQPEIDVLRQLIELTTENSRQAKEALKTANETVVVVNNASTKVEELKATLENTIREAQEMLDKLGDLGDKTKITYTILASEEELPDPGENGVIYLILPKWKGISNTYVEYLWIDVESKYEIIGELPRAEIHVDSMLDKTSENAIQNKPVATQFEVLNNKFSNRELVYYSAGTQDELDTILNRLLSIYGQYRLNVTKSDLIIPEGMYEVEYFKGSDTYAIQTIKGYNLDSPIIIRILYNGVWHTQFVLNDRYAKNNFKTLTQFIEIPKGADLKSNAYLIPGNYKCTSDDRARSLVNSPLQMGFTLCVSYGTGEGEYINQSFKTYSGSEIVERTYSGYSSVWGREYRYLGAVE